MPTNITPVSTFTPTVTVPVDGDPRNGASVQGAFQALTNRTEHTHDQLALLLDEGASHVRTAADAAALRAITSHGSGDIAGLRNGNNGRFFIYDAASTATDDGVLVIKPTDVGVGAGRWLHPGIAMLSHGNTWPASQTFSGGVVASSVTATGVGSSVATDGFMFASGDIDCDGAFSCGGLAVCNAGLVDPTFAAIDCNGSLDVSGFSSLHSGVHCYDGFQVDGSATFGGSASFNGPIYTTDNGYMRRRVVVGADADTTYSVVASGGATVAEVVEVTVNLTGNRVYTIIDPPANGITFEIFTNPAVGTLTNHVEVKSENGINIVGPSKYIGESAGEFRSARFISRANAWNCCGREPV